MTVTIPPLPSLGALEALPPERADAAENRQAILLAARELLGERSIQEITMTDVAARAGVGQGTLYRRFESKAMLAKALLLEAMLAIDHELHERRTASATPREVLDWFVASMVELVTTRADLVAAIIMKEDMLASWWTQTPAARWLRGVLSGLFDAVAPGAGGERYASFVIPAVMALEPAATPAQRRAAQGEIAYLVDILVKGAMAAERR